MVGLRSKEKIDRLLVDIIDNKNGSRRGMPKLLQRGVALGKEAYILKSGENHSRKLFEELLKGVSMGENVDQFAECVEGWEGPSNASPWILHPGRETTSVHSDIEGHKVRQFKGTCVEFFSVFYYAKGSGDVTVTIYPVGRLDRDKRDMDEKDIVKHLEGGYTKKVLVCQPGHYIIFPSILLHKVSGAADRYIINALVYPTEKWRERELSTARGQFSLKA